jgi:hypothetical protein
MIKNGVFKLFLALFAQFRHIFAIWALSDSNCRPEGKSAQYAHIKSDD